MPVNGFDNITLWALDNDFEIGFLLKDGTANHLYLNDCCSDHAASKINFLWFPLEEMKALESNQIIDGIWHPSGFQRAAPHSASPIN